MPRAAWPPALQGCSRPSVPSRCVGFGCWWVLVLVVRWPVSMGHPKASAAAGPLLVSGREGRAVASW